MRILICIILAFQLIPFCKFCCVLLRRVFRPWRNSHRLQKIRENLRFAFPIMKALASLEYWLFPLRRYLVTIPLIGLLLIQALLLNWKGMFLPAGVLIFFGVVVLVSLWAEYAKLLVDLNALELLKIFPAMHPSDFFLRYRLALAFGLEDFFNTQDLKKLSLFTVNFRHEIHASQSLMLSLKCLFDTYMLTQMARSALMKLGQNYFDGIIDPLMALWGKRILERCRVYLTVTGADQLFDLDGHVVFVSNRKSWFDLAVLTCAFSDVRLRHRKLRLRFVLPSTALCCFMGLHRLVRHIPIFAASNEIDQQQEIVSCALREQQDLFLFPQEALALANVDRAQKRRDAGYFSTQISSETGDHLEPCAAMIVSRMLEAVPENQMTEDLHIAFTALKGTANVLPAGAVRVQTEVEIHVNVGQVLTLEPQALKQFSVPIKSEAGDTNHEHAVFCEKLTQLMDRELQSALGVHQSFIQRYLTELKGQFRYDDEKIELVKNHLLDSAKQSDVVFKILDATYALPVSCWNSYLSHFSQLLLEKARVAQFEHLLNEVRQELVKSK